MKKVTYSKRICRQKGVAFIWLGMTLVPIMGFSFWAVEGTRYVQEHSRARDAAEAAAIAITVQDQSANAPDLALRYFNSYIRDIESSKVETERYYHEESENDTEYIQYTVDVTTTHASWFKSHFIPSFDEKQKITASSVARKYPEYLGDKLVNLALVADFSGSMKGNKVDSLKKAVKSIGQEVLVAREGEASIENRIALVPFNIRTQSSVSGSGCLSGGIGSCNSDSQLRYKGNYPKDEFSVKYEKVDWGKWSSLTYSGLESCLEENWESCQVDNVGVADRLEQAKRVKHVIDSHRSFSLLEHPDYIRFKKTIDDFAVDKRKIRNFSFDQNNNNLYLTIAKGNFETIPFTSKYSELERIDSMSPNGGTAVYQGLLRAMQMLYEELPKPDATEEEIEIGNNTIPMIIILSDGKEDPYPEIFQNLVDKGLCDRAREFIPGLFIGFVRIQYTLGSGDSDPFWICVTEEGQNSEDSLDKIVSVDNLDLLTETIKELIRKGAKGSGTTKLY
ncbi:pilus assembly protein TadG-related protein [Vibrio wakamikoensis]|uniref:pilus assembly protein TadG-related protein n=1 Tax=Vibrio wakamikoensis TaxID=2910251 RepID=UPI003D22EA07